MSQKITLQNVRVHNLKSVSLALDPGELILFTGISGSGKTSMAFDTLYVEGQRRYVESLSGNVKRFLHDLPKPDLDFAEGITPTISIEQKTASKNPRSTVGTITEIYDYMRLLWARLATAICPESGEVVSARSSEEIIDEVLAIEPNTRLIIMSPFQRAKKGAFKDDLAFIQNKGFTRVRIDKNFYAIDDEINLDTKVAHDLDVVIDRVVIEKENQQRITESISMALEIGNGQLVLYFPDSDDERFLSTSGYSQKSKKSYPPLDAQDFSFNSPQGSCEECQGLGVKQVFDLSKVLDPEKSIAEDCLSIASSYNTVRYGNIYANLARLYDFDLTSPFKELPEKAKQVFLYGTEKKWTRMHFVHPETGAVWYDTIRWQGALHDAYKRYQEAKSDLYKRKMERLMHKGICPECLGERLKAYPRAALFEKKRIAQVTQMTIDEALNFFSKVRLEKTRKQIGEEVLKEIIERLQFLHNVGLEYLSLDRQSPTLSGGEAQRVRLASQIGSGLVGITYILDEPSIGLHAKDNVKLIDSLIKLRDKGNTVVVIEHDEETIKAADSVVDFGPRAGSEGGTITFQGSYKKLLSCKKSLTADYLTGRKTIPACTKPREKTGSLYLKGATHNNLKNVDLEIPLGVFTAITGVSGSGKSSLFLETLYPVLSNRLNKTELTEGSFSTIENIEAIDKVIEIDQSPIGRTPRSNPATYTKLFDHIRTLFSDLPQAKAKGFGPGRFSFNVKEGSCLECGGMGQIKIDMDFLSDSWIDCPTCHGKRFDQETLQVRYKDKNISDVLEMDVCQALEHFANIPHIVEKLNLLKRVGLDYLKIGQFSTTLSGGEAQRIKLVRELSRPDTGKTLYILDEPTTGLHFHDIHHLLQVIQALVDKGNSVCVIEHNIDLIAAADWIIELGPKSGDEGGKIIATGTPAEIKKLSCPTAKALNHSYKPHTKAKAKKSQRITEIETIKAEQNNLKKCSISIPKDKLTVCTGPSGSGKSSFAFETLFSEGQRRYTESLSAYIRQFVKQMPKPKVESITGLMPSVAIEAKHTSQNIRSTVGTMTEVYDYLRILFSRQGIAHCPKTGKKITAISKEVVVDKVLESPEGTKLQILAPIVIKRSESLVDLLDRYEKMGFIRARVNNTIYDIEDAKKLSFESKKKNTLEIVIDRIVSDPSQKSRLFEAISTASSVGKKKVIVLANDTAHLYNLAFSVVQTGESYPEITPQTFAFNTPHGMCLECQGLGMNYGIDFTILPDILKLSAEEVLCYLSSGFRKSLRARLFSTLKIDPHTPLKELSEKELKMFLKGSDIPIKDKSRLFYWRGIEEAIELVLKLHSESEELPIPDEWRDALCENRCQSCAGTRINALARHVTISGKSIADICFMPIEKAKLFIDSLSPKTDDKVLQQVYDELKQKLHFLVEIGLGYLSLSRSSTTLSGGEAQRVRLARQIGSGLTSVLYVIDEPTRGLHPVDRKRLYKSLETLKELGNTLVVVEHDHEIIKRADQVVEFGPSSGARGGTIIAEAHPEKLPATSLTKKYLKTETFSSWQENRVVKRKASDGFLEIEKAKLHNLKNISCSIPLARFTTLTGVSGSGKSTLLEGILLQACKRALARKKESDETEAYKVSGLDHFTKCVWVDQRPVGKTMRSDIATYTEVLGPIRSFFAELPDAKKHGLQPKHFSTYHRKGMCSHCWGMGYKRIEMHFLPAVQIDCPKCHGLRLNPLSLSVHYQGKNVGEILKCSVDECRRLFSAHPKIIRTLDTLIAVGLGYISLGQKIQTLSGGELQRIKLSRELSKRAQGKVLYLLDEPTTGLHPQEVEKVVHLIDGLVNKGHTVVAIEHNLDFIKSSDHIIDIGPGASDAGGKVVFTGSIDELKKAKNSQTASFI